MSLQYYIDDLTSDIEKLSKKLKKIKSERKLCLSLKLNFLKFIKENNVLIKQMHKNKNGLYESYELNELVIIKKFHKNEIILNGYNIKIGDVITIDEISFNDRMIFNVNGIKLDNKDDIVIDRLYSDKKYILNGK